MGIKKIDGSLLKKCIMHSAAVLRQNRGIVDALNVFPVPDGDTGTNMSLTMDQAAKDIEKLETEDLKKIADTLAWGSLMGARGNSGVILSQLFRGFAQSISAQKDHLSSADFARALRSGVDAAYRAVMRPVEGTMLTVARETADRMLQEAEHIEDIEVVIGNALRHGEKILEKTPEMLKALKEANVVDAGGKGFVLILSGILEVVKNPEITIEYTQVASEAEVLPKDTFTQEQELKYIYCTELFISGKAINIESLRQDLSFIGDSIVVVGEASMAKVHVHTNNPGKVLEMAVALGELSNIKIDNMKLQHQETIAGALAKTEVPETASVKDEQREIGVVAVSPGDGLAEIFKSMGAEVIEGGQSMNPSTEALLKAIKRQGAKHTIILPNNKNIIMTAQQVASLGEEEISIIKSKSVPQGIAAMLAFNPASSVKENVENMTKAIATVISGEVTRAVRDSQYNGEKINEGDVLGIEDGELLFVNSDEEKVLGQLIEHMVSGKESGIMTIYYGEDVEEASVEKLCQILTDKYENFDVEYYFGGQSLYPYIVSVE